MKQLKLIVSIGALLTSFTLFAQESIVLALPDTAAKHADTLRVDVKVQHFTQIVSFQFSLQFDPQVIQYVSEEIAALPNVAVGKSGATNGILRFSWFDVQGSGQTLPDGSAIIRLKFFVNGNDGDFTDLLFTNTPIKIEFHRPNPSGAADIVPVTPKNGSVAVGTQTIFQTSFSITNVLCKGASTGAISTTLINKPASATIQWTGPNNFQSQQEDLSGLIAGAYQLQIKNNGNTLLDTTFNILQPATALAIDTITTVQASCTQTTGSATISASGGVQPYRYSIGSNFSVNSQFSNLNPGLYNVTVRDSNSCTVADTFRIIRSTGAPQLNLADSISICNGQDKTIDAGTFASYHWSNGANTRSITISTPGVYGVTVTNAGGCTASDSVRVLAGAVPQIQLADTVSVCPGQNTILDPGAFSTYNWSNGATTRTINVSTTGIYKVTVTNTAGCTASDSTQVLAGNTFSLQLPDTVSICNGQNATLDAGAFANYQWSTGATSRTINVSIAGIYKVTVTNATGCTASDSVRVLTSNAPSVPLADSVFLCKDRTLNLDAGAQSSYRWSTGATTRSIVVSNTGTYAVTVTNASGCNASDSIRVLAGSVPQIQLADSISLCKGQNIALDAGIFTTYRWSNGATTRTIPVSSAGIYKVTVTNVAGCEATDSIRVQAADAPTLELGDTAFICNSENLMLDAGQYNTYGWSTGATTRMISISTAGNYSVTVTNAAGCAASDTIPVVANANFEVKIENDVLAVCPGGNMILRASPADTYQWIDTSKTLSAVNIGNPIAQPKVTTGYTLIATSGCGTDTVKVEVKVYEITSTAGPDTTIAPGEELKLYASGGVNYFWFVSEYPVSNARIPDPTTQPQDSTSYFVMITDVNGCQKLDTVNVFVSDNPLDIKAVNMITPNGDGRNDVLEFKGLENYGLNILKVYNRWGDEVYQKINYQKDQERFDGTRNGKPLPAGNYYYVLAFNEGNIKQTLTIVRD